jgi:osmotically inducible protein OsmC
MALSHVLGERGTPPGRLEVSGVVTFAQVDGGFKIASSALDVRAAVPGLDNAAFEDAAEAARSDCPVSGTPVGNVDIVQTARLE